MGPDLSAHFTLLVQLLEPPAQPADPNRIAHAVDQIDGQWDTFERLAHRHRVTRRVASALMAAGVTVPETLSRQAKAGALSAMQQLAETHRIQSTLQDRGIACLVLKGAVLSQTLYGDPALRESKDIDLLVARADFGPAITALTDVLGYSCPAKPPVDSSRYPLWLDGNKDVSLSSPEGVRVELHHRLTATKALLPTLGMQHASDAVRIGAKSFAQFDRANLFVYLCVHGAVSRWHRLTWLADIRAMLASANEAQMIEWHANAAAHGVQRCTLSAMMLVQRLWDQPLPPAITQAAATDPNVARIIENSLITITDEAHLPATTQGRSYVRHALLLRDGWAYRSSVMKEVALDPDLVGDVPITYRLRYLYVPLRLAQWVKRKVAKVFG